LPDFSWCNGKNGKRNKCLTTIHTYVPKLPRNNPYDHEIYPKFFFLGLPKYTKVGLLVCRYTSGT
jgi:hypothetical protein